MDAALKRRLEARFGDRLTAPVYQRHDETEIRIGPGDVPDVKAGLPSFESIAALQTGRNVPYTDKDGKAELISVAGASPNIFTSSIRRTVICALVSWGISALRWATKASRVFCDATRGEG